MPDESTLAVEVTKLTDGRKAGVAEDVVVTEAPLEIRLDDVPIAVVMRTPGHDVDLARGFLLTEGIVFSPDEIDAVRPASGEGDRLNVSLAPGVAIDPEQFRRNLYTTSSCGVCGKASIDAVRITARSIADGPLVPPGRLDAMASELRAGQATFDETGGLHGAALFADDQLMSLREDVGRHNAVDKVIGAAAVAEWPLAAKVLMVSGRVSFEIVQKAAVAGIPIVAGISAASSLAVELAGELGMTAIGFVRPGRATIYTGPERVA